MSNRWLGKIYPTIDEASRALGNYQQIVPGWLSTTGVSILVGSKGDGKTLALVDQALSLATDQDDWMGFPIAQGWHAIYLSGEFQSLTLHHAKAWEIAHEAQPDPGRFMFSDLVPQLMNRDDIDLVIPELRRLLPDNGKAVIYIDTLQRAVTGAELNSAKEMSTAIENVEYLGMALKSPIVFAAHPPKGSNPDDPLGSSVVGNATGAMWEMHCVDGNGKKACKYLPPNALHLTRVTRYKGEAATGKFYSRIEAREIGGKDDYDRPYTGALLVQEKGQGAQGVPMINRTPHENNPDDMAMLGFIRDYEPASLADMAHDLDWFNSKGEPDKSRAQRVADRLLRAGKIKRSADRVGFDLADGSG